MDKRQQTLAVVGGTVGAFLAYEYAYKPWKLRQAYLAEMRRQAMLYQSQHGGSWQDAVSNVASAICGKVGSVYHVPPSMRGPMCSIAGALVGKILHSKSALINPIMTAKASIALTKDSIKDVGYAAKNIGHNVATSLLNPVNDFKALKSGPKGIAKALYNSALTNPVKTAQFAGKETEAAGKAVGHTLKKFFKSFW